MKNFDLYVNLLNTSSIYLSNRIQTPKGIHSMCSYICKSLSSHDGNYEDYRSILLHLKTHVLVEKHKLKNWFNIKYNNELLVIDTAIDILNCFERRFG